MLYNNTKSVIIGHYGKDNLGDESILTVLLYYIGRKNCTVLGLDSNKIKKSHRVSAFNLMSIMSIITIFKSKTVIFGGGALLKNTSLLKLSPFLILSKLFGNKIIFFGVDVYPLSALFKPLLKLCINKDTLICVRNNQSVSNLNNIGINQHICVCNDLAFSLPSILEISNIKEECTQIKTIGISLRPSTFADKFDTNDLVEKTITQVLHLLSEQPHLILLIPTQPIDETILFEFATSIKKKSNVEVKWSNHNYDIIKALNSIKSCDLIIGMRYHSLVFAKIMNVPFIAIPYSLKVETFANDCAMPILDDNIYSKKAYNNKYDNEINYESAEKYLRILVNLLVSGKKPQGISQECIN